MTYREKLQKENPKKVSPEAIGGCVGCPHAYGYETYQQRPCASKEIAEQPSEIRCTNCWNRVIPGTEEKEYENMSRDELITIIKLLEGRIDTKSELIARYTAACTDKNEKIKELEDKVAELEKKNKEIERLTKELDEQRHYTGSLINEVTKKNKKIFDLDKSLETAKSYADYWMGVSDRYSSDNFQLRCDLSKLNEELDEEKKAHAKHHSWLGKYFAD